MQEAQERRHRAVPRAERRRAEPLHRRFQGSILEKKGVDPTTLSTQDNQTPGTDGLEAVKEYIRLYDEGGVTRDTVGISGDDMKTQFTNGQVAMIVDGAWDLPPSNRPA